MASAIDVPRKLRQLDNDVTEIYKTLSSISATQQQHGKQLEGIDTRLEGVDSRLEGVDSHLEGVDSHLEGVDSRLNGMNTKLDIIINALSLDDAP